MSFKTPLFAAAATLAMSAGVLAVSTLALAQDASASVTAPAEAPQTGATSAAFTDAQIDRFAAAMADVQALNQSYGPKVEGAGDTTARATLQSQLTTEMTAAVKAAGLTAEEYNQIAAAAQGDAALRARIGRSMQAKADAGAEANANAEADGEDEPDSASEM